MEHANANAGFRTTNNVDITSEQDRDRIKYGQMWIRLANSLKANFCEGTSKSSEKFFEELSNNARRLGASVD